MKTKTPSGSITVRTTKTIHSMLKDIAEEEGVSLNHYISQVLTSAVEKARPEKEESKQMGFNFTALSRPIIG